MDGIGWALSAMSAARTRLDVAAANLANGTTDGFRRAAVRGVLTNAGVAMYKTTDPAQGAFRRTGREFDLAIAGQGAFRLHDAAAGTVYTRCGAFTRDRDGTVRDTRGRALVGSLGPVRVPEGASIDEHGNVVQNGRVINRIELPAHSLVRHGFLESSNVDAVSETIEVLTAQRSFESAQKVLSAIDQTRERAVTQVPQVRA